MAIPNNDHDARCPLCGSPAVLGPDPFDGLYDCTSCNTWFDPARPEQAFRFKLTSSPGTEGDNNDTEDTAKDE